MAYPTRIPAPNTIAVPRGRTATRATPITAPRINIFMLLWWLEINKKSSLYETDCDFVAPKRRIAKFSVSEALGKSFDTGHDGRDDAAVFQIKRDLPVARFRNHLIGGSLIKLPEVWTGT
jgi:hypothetical protein